MAEPESDTLSTRLSLLYRVRDLDDAGSWEEFFRRYEQLVRGMARRRGLRDHEADEVAQEVFNRIARTIHNFDRAPRRGAFRKWLGQLTRWRVQDKLRERRRYPAEAEEVREEGTPIIERVPAPPDPQLEFEEETRGHLLEMLFERIKSRVPLKQIQIFQLMVVEGMPTGEVARLYGLTTTNLYVIKHRITQRLREEVRQLPLHRD